MTFFSLQDLGLLGSTNQILQNWLLAMQAQFPGYTPSTGNLEYILAQIFAAHAADLALLCSSGADELFQTFGTQLINLPVQNGSPALAVVSVTAQDTNGYTLSAGSQISLTLNGAAFGFQTSTILVIPQGSTSGTVTVNAVAPGTAYNGAGAPAQMITPVSWVTNISVTTSAASGVDAEDQSSYLQRLQETLTLMAPRPITASDYATMSLSFTPAPGTDQQEVGRAVAIDGFDPPPLSGGVIGAMGIGWAGSNTFSNEREVTVCATDAVGNILTQDTYTALQAFLANLRELNFIVNCVSPNYNTIYVTVTVKAAAGYQAATVQQNIQTALLNYLSPQSFGLPVGSTAGWTNYTTLYQSKILAVVQNTFGVDNVTTSSLRFDVVNPPVNTGDLALTGAFPLPLTNASSIPLSGITVNT
jgi:uncharacterized phage protein gp47/JayE